MPKIASYEKQFCIFAVIKILTSQREKVR